MSGKTKDLDKAKRAVDLEVELFVKLLQAAEALGQGAAEVLRPAGLTPAQYNVLRILRGAGTQGLSCSQIRDRLITRDSDITRLLDRLEAAGWVSRQRETEDRRMVLSRISESGLFLLASLDEPMAAHHRATFAHVPRKRLRELAEVLDLVLGN